MDIAEVGFGVGLDDAPVSRGVQGGLEFPVGVSGEVGAWDGSWLLVVTGCRGRKEWQDQHTDQEVPAPG